MCRRIPGLDGSLVSLVRDLAGDAALVEQSAGAGGVVAGVQVRGDVLLGQWSQVVRWRWQPSGCEGSVAGRAGRRVSNWTHNGSMSQDGSAGTDDLVLITGRRQPSDLEAPCLCVTSSPEPTAYPRGLLSVPVRRFSPSRARPGVSAVRVPGYCRSSRTGGLLLQITLALRLPGRSRTSRRVSTHRTLLGFCSVVPAPSPQLPAGS
jgi:hypothetical protein